MTHEYAPTDLAAYSGAVLRLRLLLSESFHRLNQLAEVVDQLEAMP